MVAIVVAAKYYELELESVVEFGTFELVLSLVMLVVGIGYLHRIHNFVYLAVARNIVVVAGVVVVVVGIELVAELVVVLAA